ncbi:hypothetical protein ACQPZX_05380 [Actinoplanes sp. CA-142083]|uniref:hypothetical protein n=1 Tax=Actinoplanes sp. CA-142083 TaxID=3239903 RepID=UPI003D94C036
MVEIELSHHDLRHHVIPQVEVFRTANYGAYHAAALARTSTDLDADRLEAMMRGVSPGVLVVVDTPSTAWGEPLAAIDVRLAIVEPFRDPNARLLLRLNGYQPEPPGEILTRCSRHKLRRLWRVHSPAALPGAVDEPLQISYLGNVSVWKKIQLNDAVMLQAQKGDVLAELTSADLVVRDDGTLAFISIGRR